MSSQTRPTDVCKTLETGKRSANEACCLTRTKQSADRKRNVRSTHAYGHVIKLSKLNNQREQRLLHTAHQSNIWQNTSVVTVPYRKKSRCPTPKMKHEKLRIAKRYATLENTHSSWDVRKGQCEEQTTTPHKQQFIWKAGVMLYARMPISKACVHANTF